ncbi:MAG: cytochrome c [Pseudomonadota bacterium]
MHRQLALAAALAAAGTLALAHAGVEDPDVMARMHSMKDIASANKAVGLMLRGQAPFDPSVIAQSAKIIAVESARIPVLFESQADDPKSEALPAIWENWADFEAKAEAGVVAAEALGGVQREAELAPAFNAVGKTCKACHTAYRE